MVPVEDQVGEPCDGKSSLKAFQAREYRDQDMKRESVRWKTIIKLNEERHIRYIQFCFPSQSFATLLVY